VAWRSGIVVKVSAGNNGTGGMTNPAIDPFVLAVGAMDTKGTKAVVDDVIPAFSSQGLGSRPPDVVAPGVHLQSLWCPAPPSTPCSAPRRRTADPAGLGLLTAPAIHRRAV
jgi:serine protease AprX